MRKIVWTFGLIAGAICIAMFLISMPAQGETMDFENGETFGYLTMLVALSMIFFAVLQYRKRFTDGYIKFGKAFLVGLYVSLIATLVYVVGWEIIYNTTASDFADQYVEYQREVLQDEGLSDEEITAQMGTLEDQMQMYKNNMPFRMAMTSVEILPLGLLISLLVAAIFSFFMKPKEGAVVV